jgi:hypothetical protein
MKKLNTKGFSVVEAALLVAVLGLLGFAGYTVLKKDKPKQADNPSTQPTQQAKKTTAYTFELPSGYKYYEDTVNGFKFAYPSVYGNIEQKTDQIVGTYIGSSSLQNTFGPGIAGSFILLTHSLKDSITSRKYGPEITLKDGKLFVTKPSESDLNKQNVGDEYIDLNKKPVPTQTNGKVIVYDIVGGDEGVTQHKLLFVSNSKLYELEIPSFSEGSFGDTTSTSKPNDPGPYSTFLKNVINSVQATK